jgi:hypothetical protein
MEGTLLLQALDSFPDAQGLKESVGWGAGGGAVITGLRYWQLRGHPLAATRAAFSGAVVFGLTTGVAWVVYRREVLANERPLIGKLIKLKALQDLHKDSQR